MDTSSGLSHTVTLPHGYTVTFRWSSNGVVTVWAPHIPRIRNPRQRRRFLDDYDVARNDFMVEVATAINETITVATVEGEVTVIRPAVRH